MKVYKDEIQIVKGENFTYDVDLKYKNNAPYIISSMLENPYILTTIATGKYFQYGRVVYNYWSDLKIKRPTNRKVFYVNNLSIADPWFASVIQIVNTEDLPMQVGDCIYGMKDRRYGIVTSVGELTFNFEPLSEFGKTFEINPNYIPPNRFYVTTPVKVTATTIASKLSPYEYASSELKIEYRELLNEGILSIDLDNYAIFYTDINNEITYYYWTGSEYKEYVNSFVIEFSAMDTINFVEQSYDFSMKVVDGVKNKDAKTSDDRPIVNIRFMQELNSPLKLSVFSNIDGSVEVNKNERT